MAGETTDKRKRRLEDAGVLGNVDRDCCAHVGPLRERLVEAEARLKDEHSRWLTAQEHIATWKQIAISLGVVENGDGTITVPDHRMSESDFNELQFYRRPRQAQELITRTDAGIIDVETFSGFWKRLFR